MNESGSEIRALQQSCRNIVDQLEIDSNLDERELVTLFFQNDFFSTLGYGRVGQDIRLEQRIHERNRVDILLKSFTGRSIIVIEFKNPNIDLSDHLNQLLDYSLHLLPKIAVLTNGFEFWLFQVDKNGLGGPKIIKFRTMNLKEASFIHSHLFKKILDWRRHEDVNEALEECKHNFVEIDFPNQPGGRLFLNQFQLHELSPFGRLVRSLFNSLGDLISLSDFTSGALEFWTRVYSGRQLSIEEVPNNWKVFLADNESRSLYRFMFALETAYVIISRTILAKAMSDARFPYLDTVESFKSKLNELQKRGLLEPINYLDATEAIFSNASQQAFESLFASDIFDWWMDANLLDRPDQLCESLAEAIYSIFEFDFSKISGDILGDLYQSYFDPITRTTLGEFYTPPEVVDYILDNVGYRGSAIRNRRLLDPACGSGTFLIQAISRYLESRKGFNPTDTLRNLVESHHIVGFDINPFAVMMSQVNYAASILPLYTKVIKKEPNFAVHSVPVYRTDSLRKELEESEVDENGQIGLSLHYEGGVIIIGTVLPVRTTNGDFLSVEVPILSYHNIRSKGLITNIQQ